MNSPAKAYLTVLQFIIYWAAVGIPLAWGVWKTALKLPALFQ